MKKPRINISVLMASYNHKAWIADAIESVLNQTYCNFELIIVDDGSTDGSGDVIKEYAKKDSRIHYELLASNIGAVAATKRCYNQSTYDYIAIINSDDVWNPTKLERQIACFEADNTLDIVFTTGLLINQTGKKIHYNRNEFERKLHLKTKEALMNYFFFHGNPLWHPSVLIKKSCYETHGFYHMALRYLPDFELWARLCLHCNLLVLNEQLIQLRQHAFNESGNTTINTIRKNYELKLWYATFLNQIKTLDQLKTIFPNHHSLFKVEDNCLIPFYVAQLARLIHKKPADDFAFSILYQELNKPNVLSLVTKNQLYSTYQLSNDVVQADLYSNYYDKTFIRIPGLLALYQKKDDDLSVTIVLQLFHFIFVKFPKNPTI